VLRSPTLAKPRLNLRTDRKEFLELIERVANQMPEERQRGFIRDIPRMIGMVE